LFFVCVFVDLKTVTAYTFVEIKSFNNYRNNMPRSVSGKSTAVTQLALYTKVLATIPKSSMKQRANILAIVGGLQHSLQKNNEAYKSLSEAICIDPSCMLAYQRRGSVNIVFKKFLEAEQDLSNAKNINSHSEHTSYLFALLLDERAKEDRKLVLLQKATSFYVKKMNSEALKILEELLQIDQFDVECKTLLGKCLYGLKRYEEAEKEFEFLVKKEVFDFDILFKYATILYRSEDFDVALELLTKAISINPADIEALFMSGRIYYNKMNYSKAIEFFDKSIESINNYSELTEDKIKYSSYLSLNLELRGSSKYKLLDVSEKCRSNSKLKSAVEDFELSIKINKNLKSMQALGTIFIEIEDYERALFWINESFVVKPKDFKSLSLSMIFLFKSKRFQELEECVLKVMEWKPGNLEFLDFLLYYPKLSELVGEISIILSKIILKFPKNHIAFFAKGKIYYKSKSYEDAKDAFQEAFKLSPNKHYLQNLIKACIKLKDYETPLNFLPSYLEGTLVDLDFLLLTSQIYELKNDPRKAIQYKIQFLSAFEKQYKYPNFVGSVQLAINYFLLLEHDSAFTTLSELKEKLKISNKLTVEKSLSIDKIEASFYKSLGNYKQTLRILDRNIDQYDSLTNEKDDEFLANLYFEKAFLEFFQVNVNTSSNSLKQAVHLEPQNDLASIMQLAIHTVNNELVEANALMEDLNIEEETSFSFLMTGELHRRSNRLDDAIQALNSSIALDSTPCLPYLFLSIVYYQKKESQLCLLHIANFKIKFTQENEFSEEFRESLVSLVNLLSKKIRGQLSEVPLPFFNSGILNFENYIGNILMTIISAD